MFGYIRPFKPEMKVREFELYKAVYCGLCHTLGKRGSFFARLLLNYDDTFLVLLSMSLSDVCGGFTKYACPVKCFTKRMCCRSGEDMEFACDSAVILGYYKLRDDIKDASGFKKIPALLCMPFVSPMFKKAAKRCPETAADAGQFISDQEKAEKAGAGIDAAADPTAKMTAKLVLGAARGRANERVLERMGYFLGRWVYFADALDDLASDLESGSYNPFVSAYELRKGDKLDGARTHIKPLMNQCLYEIAAAFELIDIKQCRTILANIFYLGLPDVQKRLLAGEKLKPI